MKSKDNIWIQTALGTVIAINLMIGGLLVSKNMIPIEAAPPTIATSSRADLSVEYKMEFLGKEQKDAWVVEHYAEYEYIYNKKGEIISKQPTTKKENLRYWIAPKEEKSPSR